MATESTITRPTATRLKHDEVDRLRQLAAREGVTLSSLLARLAREGITRLGAAA
jgi:predicted DNA-binding ribbon-helix-helix protein